MGHNMGMLHDFDDDNGGQNSACNGQGLMSYGSAPQQWSTCSQANYLARYNQVGGNNWCMSGIRIYNKSLMYIIFSFLSPHRCPNSLWNIPTNNHYNTFTNHNDCSSYNIISSSNYNHWRANNHNVSNSYNILSSADYDH